MSKISGRLPGQKFMSEHFSNGPWRASLPDLEWGAVLGGIAPHLLWVLETTIPQDDDRTLAAERLAAACKWFGKSLTAVAVADTERREYQKPRLAKGFGGFDVLIVPERSFSVDEQESVLAGFSAYEWPEGVSEDWVNQCIELALMNWYITVMPSRGTDCLLALTTVGVSFYVFPTERRHEVTCAFQGG